jgi:hypothetical protein
MTTETFVLSEEMVAGPARLRIDVLGGEPRDHVLDDMSFMDYRLADVRIAPEATLPEPDVVWSREGEKGIAYDGRRMTFSGDWPAGPVQKVIVAMLALRMEAVGLHPSHSSAVRYRDRTILFLGGESNHGKSMGPDRGLPPRCKPRLNGDDRDRRGRAGSHGLEIGLPEEADRGNRSGPTRRAPRPASRSSSATCRPGTCTRSRASSTS